MSIETAFVTRATTHSGLSALIGTRAFPETPSRKTALPYLVFKRVSAVPQHAMGNTVATMFRYQVDGYAATKTDVIALEAEIIAAFNFWAGTYGADVIEASLDEDSRDLTELLDTEAEMRCVSHDFMVTHS